jgi:hypothetical protein
MERGVGPMTDLLRHVRAIPGAVGFIAQLQ